MKSRSLIVAAVLSVMVSGAFAQTRVDRSGATDASNRVGSNGRNQVGGRENPWDIQNRIVYGNSTGGTAFRGPTASRDPQAFRGPTGSGTSDRFIRDSSGVTTGGVATYNANQSRAYYGDSRGVNAPTGTVGVSSLGAYSPPTPTAWNNVDVRTSAISNGVTVINRATEDTTIAGGNVNTQYAPGAINVPPAASINGISDYTALNSPTLNTNGPAAVKGALSDDPTPRLPGQTPLNGVNSNAVDAGVQQVPTSGNPVNNANTLNTPAGDTTPAGQPGVKTNAIDPTNVPEAGTVTRFIERADAAANRPDARGTADAQTNANANQPLRPGQAAEEASRQYNAERLARNAKPDAKGTDAAKPDANNPGANNPGAGNPGMGQPDAGNAAPRAGAATDTAIADMLTKAAALTKEGKYATALDVYGAAETVAPRSGTLKLGRANAEIGGAFYRRAEGSLRQAFTLDKNLLTAQHDLRGFLGDDKLGTVQKDLADLVQSKPNDTGAAVLLAYVYYNTGNERRAAALLDVADKRANGQDALIKAMKAGWKTPADETK